VRTYPYTTILTHTLKELGADSIDFGVLVASDTMLIKTTKRTSPRGGVKMILDLGRREIDIRFPSVYSEKTREYKFLIPIDQVFNLSQLQSQIDTTTSFILTLRTPPHFYRKLSGGISATHEDAAFTWREEESWLRQTNVLSNQYEMDQLKARPVTLKNHPEGIVNIGRWTTYRITVDAKSINQEKYRVFRAALRDYNVPIARVESFTITHQGTPAWDLLDASLSEHEPIVATPTARNGLEHSLHSLLNSKENPIFLTFPVRYQLEVCITNGCINEHNITREFLEALSQTDSDRAKHILECVALNEVRIFNPMEIFNLRVRRLPSMASRIPENCFLIRSVIITPSTMMLSTPYVEMTNRVIRRYKDHSDRFLRVRFQDDEHRGYARINATSQKTINEILTKIHRTLNRGIVIGDRHYEFLAFGNSQLREHGAYFFAPLPSGPTASHIRAWMGRFDHERIVAKHAARIGQCFSTTRAIRNAGFPPVRKADLIDDVERNDRGFTDGVGKISRLYAEIIAKELGLRGATPSVYQFRMAGCKGVLAIDPELGASNIKIRRSQFKFETTYSGMEIIRWSEYWVATLNRQLILVLSALGVSDEVFLSIQDMEIKLMERAMVDDSAAMEALTGHVDPNRMTLTLAGLVQAGFRQSNEPFVTSLLALWRAWSIKYLKEKAKLPVRKGACILGCTDETGTLRGHFDADQMNIEAETEDKVAKLPEVFVQITSPDTGHRKVIQGLCVVARNPSLHAGDMRVVKAVDVPALHHLVDVLVMPQTGDRDLSSMCSGGDLDGDDYVVIWDERLLPKVWNEQAMDYTPPAPTPLRRDVTQDDITKFFVKYMQNDFLPKIAHAHMAWADFLDEGIRHEKCLELALLHSKAVDYPKSGQPAQMPKALNAKRWPHFMEKKSRNSYTSHKILGQLYDAVDRVAFVAKYDSPFDERILSACEPSEEMMQAARELKHEYDTSLQRIMAQHDIKTEFEVWSTFVLDHSKASKDYKFHEEIGQLSNSLKEQYFNAVVEKAGGKRWEHLIPWAVAMYRVTKEELDDARSQGRGSTMPFISFPWILRSTLTQIVRNVDEATSKKRDGGDALGSLQEPKFNTQTQIYDDPFQPGINGVEGGGLDTCQKEVQLVGKEEAPLDEDKMVEPIETLANGQLNSHPISNEGFHSGSYAPGLGIPPQPTAEQFDQIEEIIKGAAPSEIPAKTISKGEAASAKPGRKLSAVKKWADNVATGTHLDRCWPPMQPKSRTSASLSTSEKSTDERNSDGMVVNKTPSAVKQLSETLLKESRMATTALQSSTTSHPDSGILIDMQEDHAQDQATKKSLSTSLSEDLAGLHLTATTPALEPSPPSAPLRLGDDGLEQQYTSKNRRRSSRSIAQSRRHDGNVGLALGMHDGPMKKLSLSASRPAQGRNLLLGTVDPLPKNDLENTAITTISSSVRPIDPPLTGNKTLLLLPDHPSTSTGQLEQRNNASTKPVNVFADPFIPAGAGTHGGRSVSATAAGVVATAGRGGEEEEEEEEDTVLLDPFTSGPRGADDIDRLMVLGGFDG
jgi:RNA-dependent RNA polymerase